MFSKVPASVYRLQLSKEFPLSRAIAIIPYLNALGIEGLYCSPIFDSESSHGYDVTNPNALSPALGTLEEWEKLCTLLKEFKMFQVLDVVPNHMGIKGDNLWWIDVLRDGPQSRYAVFFDINWNPEKEELKNKILLPILEALYGNTLENGLIELVWEDGFWIKYRDFKLPICKESEPRKEDLEAYKGKKGDSKSFDLLHELLEKQHYRLSYWRVAGQEINYRRFFNINELVAIHIENENVLKEHHRWIFNLIQTEKVQGLRIDHPDGLYNPAEYFKRIKVEKPGFIIVEKILDFKEPLPEDWEVEGTVGYEYLNVLNGVFVKTQNEKKMRAIYEKFIGEKIDFKELLYQRKKNYIHLNMASEVNFLGLYLDRISEKSRYFRDFTKIELTLVLKEIIACFPVYRTYVRPGITVSKKEKKFILDAIEMAKVKMPEMDVSIFNFMQEVLLLEVDEPDFAQRFQQLTGPVMAKGLEDSVFYNFNCLLSLNEVGGNPTHFGFSKNDFHKFNWDKLEKWPLGFLASSTHDTKRSEDVRMRLNVLSEIPNKWQEKIEEWKELHKKFKKSIYPDDNTEYYIYQMILGLWPLSMDRLWPIILKSIREAGTYSNWLTPNIKYEEEVSAFLQAVIDLGAFIPFADEIALLGSLNSLSHTVLKMGCPGIVDIYQGNEWLTLTSVDPDNRRPIDFDWLKSALNALPNKFNPELTLNLKLWVTTKALHLRNKFKDLFLAGEYISIPINNENVIAYMRKYNDQAAIFIVRRFFSEPLEESNLEISFEGKWTNILTDENFHKSTISLRQLFKQLPVAILILNT